jgi:hypothetical protein
MNTTVHLMTVNSGPSVVSSEEPALPQDTPQVLLEHYLKVLRLPSFWREYDKVAGQCAQEGQEGVDHPRYLLRLCELEVLDREHKAMERRIRQARFPVLKSLDRRAWTEEPGQL